MRCVASWRLILCSEWWWVWYRWQLQDPCRVWIEMSNTRQEIHNRRLLQTTEVLQLSTAQSNGYKEMPQIRQPLLYTRQQHFNLRRTQWITLAKHFGSYYKLYGGELVARPTRKDPEVAILSQRLKDYCDTTVFSAEFPSVRGVECPIGSTVVASPDDVRCRHQCNTKVTDLLKFDATAIYLTQAGEALYNAYRLLQRPAKEVLLTMASDLDRISSAAEDMPHAIPIMYHMGGFSLKMNAVPSLLRDAINKCATHDLEVRSIAFDGQFLELAVADGQGEPLTTCRFQKEVWREAKAVPKKAQISYLANRNYGGPVTPDNLCTEYSVSRDPGKNNSLWIKSTKGYPTLYTPRNFSWFLVKPDDRRRVQVEGELDTANDPAVTEIYQLETPIEDYILRHLSMEVIESLDESSLAAVKSANEAIHSSTRHATGMGTSEEDVVIDADNIDLHNEPIASSEAFDQSVDMEYALVGLIASSESKKWDDTCAETFRQLLSSPESIAKNFLVSELKTLLRLGDKQVSSLKRKPELVNEVSDLYGSGVHMIVKKSPKSLRTQILHMMEKWPKDATNVLYATNIFPDRYKQWYGKQMFCKPSTILTDDNHRFTIDTWYAQPARADGHLVQYIIDPHHIFVNNRSRCCSSGITGMGIKPQAWIKVAQESNHNRTGLSLELVVELRERQRNSFAQTTFSEAVECEMVKNGDNAEAEWCRLLRHWYRAVDEAGVATSQRLEWLLDMRCFLLKQYSPLNFPPPGYNFRGLPMAQFEGLLTNIDRRLQLYHITKTGTYNHRSISSLDCETMFGSFQVTWQN